MFEYFICGCWSICLNRNKIVHEGTGFDPNEAQIFVAHYIRNYKEANSQFHSPRPLDNNATVWRPPIGNVIKINFDASINRESSYAGLGLVGRNSSGDVVWRIR